MKTSSVLAILSHAQLPLEACALLHIYAMAALARFTAFPPQAARLDRQISHIWDANGLTVADLGDPERMTKLLEGYREQLLDAA
jgi:hypothetical protein